MRHPRFWIIVLVAMGSVIYMGWYLFVVTQATEQQWAEMQTPEGLVHLLATLIQEQRYDDVPRLYAIETKVTGVDSTESSFFRYNPHDGKLLRYRIVDRRW